MAGIRTVTVAGVPIHDVTFEQTAALIMRWATAASGGYVCTPNVDHVVRAQRDPEFLRAVRGARLRVPDGMWVVRAARIADTPLHGTVTGRLLIPAVAARAAAAGLPIALFGSEPGVPEAAGAALIRRNPGLQIAAMVSPPMGLVLGSKADSAAVDALRAASPQIIFVGLGAPKQECWMELHAADFPGVVLVGIGQGLDILAGRFRVAPAWATRWGMEWAFRLAQEPRRLFRRYLIDDPWLLAWAMKRRFRLLRARRAAPD